MKFVYEYRTPDNAKYEGVVRASNRDAAYAELKRQGIRPSRLTEAPGFFNKLFGKGKRWIVICVLGALCLGLAIALGRARTPVAPMVDAGLDSTVRRQPIGDAAVIEQGVRTGWANVFEHEGEQFLASFAVPGVPAGLRNTSEDEIKAALSRSVPAEEDDTIEARQIKAMVEGMKRELRQFLADKGTIVEYGRRLVARQEQELGYYNRSKNELEKAKESGLDQAELVELWQKLNAKLRRLGIKLLAMPE